MYILVYDISNDRRRTKLHDRLLNYGNPVQLSVFEIDDKCLSEVSEICLELLKKDDQVRIYHLCQRCSKGTVLYGNASAPIFENRKIPQIIEVPKSLITAKSKHKKARTVASVSEGPLELGKIGASSRLMELVCNMNNLNEAFLDVKASRGCAGSDGISLASFDRHRSEYLAALQLELLENRYRPRLLKRFDIPKPDGSTRTLRVPAVRDRVAQQAVLRVINPVWEAEFEPTSYAYRKGRSVKQAINAVERYRDEGYTWVLRSDVDDYFDEIPHDQLIERFKKQVSDSQIVDLIEKWVKCVDGTPTKVTGKGIPQGSAVSPLLSNIYLDRFDEAMCSLGYKLIRYADDFVVACKSKEEAEDSLRDATRELSHDNLRLKEAKTVVTDFKNGFVFLGYHLIGSLVIKKAKLPASWRVSKQRGK
jgi:group II intron reverse transcriptase/maturase/CRISPR-associated endonuclease Cas2